MTPRQELTNKIHTLVPETMELTDGCRVNIWWMDTPLDRPYDPDEEGVIVSLREFRDNGSWNGKYRSCIENNVCGHYEILGHDITLEDVLRAIGNTKNAQTVLSSNLVTRIYVLDCGGVDWHLGKPLHLQSEETITWLNKIIQVV